MTRSASLPWPRSLAGRLEREEVAHRLDAGGAGGLGRPRRWVDAEHRDPGLHEVPQHVAVVGGDLDHQARTAQAQPIDQLQRVGPRVLQQRGGERGIVRIIAAENLLRRNRLEDLRQAAVRTEGHLQGEFLLLGLELVAGHQPIRQGHVAQVQHGQQAGLAAGAATGGITLVSERVWVLHSKSFKKRKANSAQRIKYTAASLFLEPSNTNCSRVLLQLFPIQQDQPRMGQQICSPPQPARTGKRWVSGGRQ